MKDKMIKSSIYSSIRKAVLLIIIMAVTTIPIMHIQEAYAMSKPDKVIWDSVSSTADSVNLKWKKVKNADGYTIYKNYGDTYKAIKSVTKLTYSDSGSLKPLTYYKYYVKAYKLSGSKKIYGERSSIKTIKTLSGVPSKVVVANVTGAVGSKVTFTAEAKGGVKPFSYQWYKGTKIISGATKSSYSFAVTAGDYGSKYFCKVKNKYGTVTSNTALLNVKVNPLVSVTIDGDKIVDKGKKAAYKAIVKGGTLPLRYQWYRNGTIIQGAVSSTYTTDLLSESNTGDSFKCKVTGIDGKYLVSDSVKLTVTVPRSVVASWDIGTDVSIAYSESTALNNVTATLYDDGLLEIKGSGNALYMIDNQAMFVAPWHDQKYVGQIKKVEIQPTVQVTDMRGWFADCINLQSVNRIPSTATILWKTFWECKSLKNAPEIPYGVLSMMSAFSGCSNLTAAPSIPTSVTDMTGAFFLCASLETASDIPASVKNLSYTFSYCRKLTGKIKILGNSISNYTSCFYEAAVIGSGVKVYGSSLTDNALLVKNIVSTGGNNVEYGGVDI